MKLSNISLDVGRISLHDTVQKPSYPVRMPGPWGLYSAIAAMPSFTAWGLHNWSALYALLPKTPDGRLSWATHLDCIMTKSYTAILSSYGGSMRPPRAFICCEECTRPRSGAPMSG